MSEENTKRCPRCYLWKEFNHFTTNKSRRDGYAAVCKQCIQLVSKVYYKDNKEAQKTRMLSIKDNYITKKQEMLLEYLVKHPCADCGNSDIRVLEFDHLEQFQKTINISQALTSWSWERILEEIAKCEVVCSNCHTIRTITRANSYRNRFSISENGEVSISKKLHLNQEKIAVSEVIKSSETRQNYKTKINWPSREELEKLVWEMPRTVLAEKLGVSNKAIEKRCFSLGIEQPKRGYWTVKNKGKAYFQE